MDIYTYTTSTRGEIRIRMMGVELNSEEIYALGVSAALKKDHEAVEKDGREIKVFTVKYPGDRRRYVVCVCGKPVSVGVEIFSESLFSLKRIWKFFTNKQ